MTRKIKKLLKALYILLSTPYKSLTSLLVLTENEEYKKKVKKYYGIEQLPSITLNELFGKEILTGNIINYTYLEGAALPTDIFLLKQLASSFGESCNFIEIGSWRGETLSNVFKVTKHCTCVNLSNTEMQQKKMGNAFINAHEFFYKDNSEISKVYQNSMSFDFSSLKQTFDLAFIDGDHSYQAVKSDTEQIYAILKDENSVIVWHDYTIETEKVNYVVLAAILAGLPKEVHPYLYHVANTKSCILTRKNLNTVKIQYPSEVHTLFEINLVIKPQKLIE